MPKMLKSDGGPAMVDGKGMGDPSGSTHESVVERGVAGQKGKTGHDYQGPNSSYDIAGKGKG